MTVCVPCHMDKPRVKGLGGSGAGMLFDGGAGEWGGRGGKENTGGGDGPIVVPRNALDGDRGVLFLCPWTLLDLGTFRWWSCKDDEHLSVFTIFIIVVRSTAVRCQFLLNYVLKVALRHGMCEELSVKQPSECVKVGQLLGGWYSPSVIMPTKRNSFLAEIDNSWAGHWWPTWLTGLTCLMSTEKPEKMKIMKDDKNRLACKLTSLTPTISLLLFFFVLTPLRRTIPSGPPPPYIATLKKAGLLIV